MFTQQEQQTLITLLVDNSAETTASSSNEYACENTYDKIYLLSFQDVINTSIGFSSKWSDYDPARQAKVTDYAKATGAWWNKAEDYLDNGEWWLRSPDNSVYGQARCVLYYGIANYSYIVDYSAMGVRPATAIAVN